PPIVSGDPRKLPCLPSRARGGGGPADGAPANASLPRIDGARALRRGKSARQHRSGNCHPDAPAAARVWTLLGLEVVPPGAKEGAPSVLEGARPPAIGDERASPAVKILLVVHQFFPHHATGTQVLTLELARGLTRRGHHVDILTGESDSGESA